MPATITPPGASTGRAPEESTRQRASRRCSPRPSASPSWPVLSIAPTSSKSSTLTLLRAGRRPRTRSDARDEARDAARRPPDALVDQAGLAHARGVVEVAPVDQHVAAHRRRDLPEIERGELRP